MDNRKTKAIEPRRNPKRRLSKEIVAAILIAARQEIAARGYEGATTNQIAARAGVSIGSFYHYFPNKEAVLSMLAKQVEEETLEMFRTLQADSRDESFEVGAAKIVDLLLSPEALGNLRLRHELAKHAPRSWTWGTASAVDEAVSGALARRFSNKPGIRRGRESLMAFVVLHAVEAVVEAAVLYRNDLFESSELREELTHLAVSYLRGTSDQGDPA